MVNLPRSQNAIAANKLIQAEFAALKPVRDAIHGWVFANEIGIQNRIIIAEKAMMKIDPYYRTKANALIQQLRDALEELKS